MRSGSVFSLELGRWASILLAWTVPGPRFALPERPFCRLPHCACACDAHFVELCQNPIKTEWKPISACLCETLQPTKKRRPRASSRMLPTAACDFRFGASRPPSRAFPEALRTLLARLASCNGLWSSDWAPRDVLERPGLDLGSSGEVRVASWNASRVRFSRVLALRVTPCVRARDSVRSTKRQKKRFAFAFILRFAARACPHDFHDLPHNLRANVLLVAPN